MKQLTIKKKITLWYTGIIAVVLGTILVLVLLLWIRLEFLRQKKKSLPQ